MMYKIEFAKERDIDELAGLLDVLFSQDIEFVPDAVKQAEESGCKRVTLLTDYDNEAAIAFYQKQGFVKSAMIPLRKGL